MKRNLSFYLLILFIFSTSFKANAQLDTWIKFNEGFAKCPQIGQAAGEAVLSRDDFSVEQMLDRRGIMYAYIGYDDDGTNTQWCGDGLYRLDTIQGKWFRVADRYTNNYGGSKLLTNHDEIFAVVSGRVRQFTTDYTNYPSGWKDISKPPHDPLRGEQVFSPGSCSPTNAWESVRFSTDAMDAVGDTIYVFHEAETGCEDQNAVLKFNVHTGNWTIERVGPLPTEAAGNSVGMVFTRRIAGYFSYFFAVKWSGKELCVPQYVWTWDPRIKEWINISRGVGWNNQTGSSCNTDDCKSCIEEERYNENVDANWGPAGSVFPSWDKRNVYVTSEMGIWRWAGDKWYWLGDNRENSSVLATEQAIFTKGRDRGIEKLEPTNYAIVGGNLPHGKGTTWRKLWTPDNGKTLYVYHSSGHEDPELHDERAGIYCLKFDPDKPDRVRNLHVQTGTYMGGEGDNSPINAGVGAYHELFIAGNYSEVTGRFHPDYFANTINGASNNQRGKIIRTNSTGDTILSVMTVGNEVYDYEIQNFGEYRMVVATDNGVTVLDSTGLVELYTIPESEIAGGGAIYADIDIQGNVVALRDKRFFVYDLNGNIKNPGGTTPGGVADGIHNTKYDFVEDITIKNDTVFVIGFNNDKLNGSGCGETSGLPVQSAFVRAFANTGGGNYEFIWRTFDIDGQFLNLDQADTRGYRINVGKDGKIYYLGEAAGGNSVYRWDGKSAIALEPGCNNPSDRSRLVKTDAYNSPFNTASAHIAYFATLNPNNGEVERGMYIIPRKSDGKSNSYRIKDGYIHADREGYVYIGAASAARFAGRDIQHLNGILVDDYDGGDMTVLVVDPEYRVRTFWGTFTKDNGSGVIKGFGIRDNIIASVGATHKGYMITGATRYDPFTNRDVWKPEYAMIQEPFNPNNHEVNDSYLAVWYQDVWNHSVQDSLEERTIESEDVIDEEAFNYRPDFDVDKRVVCLGDPVTFRNTSVGDTLYWRWYFGQGSDLLPGTPGEGPHSVTYQTPGLKDIRLETYLKSGVDDYDIKDNFVNVIDPTFEIERLEGPAFVCSGVPVFYSVPIADDISYEWTIPEGAEFIQGGNGNAVEVIFGEQSGTVKVTAVSACGNISSKELFVSVTPPDDQNALLVTGEPILDATDEIIKQKLEAEGYNVIYFDDETANQTHAGCASIVVISPTVDPVTVGYTFRDVTIPVLAMHHGSFPRMGLTNGGNNDHGTEENRQSIEILDNTHQLAEGLTLGATDVYNSGYPVNYGSPSADAISIAAVSGDAGKQTLFGYREGAQMMGMPAPAKRVGFYMTLESNGNLSADGEFLLERAICWVSGTCPTINTLDTEPLLSATFCPGQAIKIPFSHTGTFGDANNFIAQLSNPFGTFTNIKELGRLMASEGDTIYGTIPDDVNTGSGYRVRVIASDPSLNGSVSATELTISGLPERPSRIIGNSLGCRFETEQEYAIRPVPGVLGYVWQSPLGTSIEGAPLINESRLSTTDTTATINFGTATTNEIKVYSRNACGLSEQPARLEVSLTSYVPDRPEVISGDDTVCVSGEFNYVTTPVENAAGYVWTIPNGASIIEGQGTARVLISFAGMSDMTTDTIKVQAEGECGLSDPEILVVQVNNDASVPQVGMFSGETEFCPGAVETYVSDPPRNFVEYRWSFPVGSIVLDDEFGNVREVKFPIAINDDITLQIENMCGISDPVSKTINVSSGESNDVYLVVADKNSINGNDVWMENKLADMGYNVILTSDEDPVPTDAACAKLILISTTAGATGDKYMDMPAPVMVNNPQVMENMALVPSSGTRTEENIRLSLDHPITEGFPLGQRIRVYNGDGLVGGGGTYNKDLCGDLGYEGATCWGKSDQRDYTMFTYETGDPVGGLDSPIEAPGRRVGFFLADNQVSLSSAGVLLFEQAVCWAASGTCGDPFIQTSNIVGSPFCDNATFDVVFLALGTFDSGNEFIAELSDLNGEFNSPMELGRISGTSSGVINVTIPDGVPAGTGYRIRVISTSPAIEGTSNPENLEISGGGAGVLTQIAGENTLCLNEEQVYRADVLENAISYDWTLPSELSGFSSSDTIQIRSGITPGSYTIAVSAESNCGSTNEVSMNILVESCLNPTANFNANRTEVCVGETISFQDVSTDATSWSWNFGNEASQQTSAMQNPEVHFTAPGTYPVSLTINPGTKDEDAITKDAYVLVKDIPAPPVRINGNAFPCEKEDITFSINEVTGAESYTWRVDGNEFAGESTSFDVSIASEAIEVGVASVNECGSSNFRTITVNPVLPPEGPGTINGESNGCAQEEKIFSIAPVNAANEYIWTFEGVELGETGTDYSHLFEESGLLTVQASNSCGVSNTSELAIKVRQLPGNISVITGSNIVCANETSERYNIDPVSDAAQYVWNVDGASIITENDTEIFVDFGSLPATIEVFASNNCGNTDTIDLQVAVDPCIYDASFTVSETEACDAESITFTDNSIGATSWDWDFGNGADPSIATGPGPHTVTYATVGEKNVSLTINKDTPEENSDIREDLIVADITPAKPERIDGAIEVCQGETKLYSVDQVEFADNYVWSLPAGVEGTSTTSSASLTFSETGTFELAVRAASACGESDPETLEVIVDPCIYIADFSLSSTDVCTSDPIDIINNSVGAESYQWNFGEGAFPATSSDENPGKIIYETPGTKTITLTINPGTEDVDEMVISNIQVTAPPEQPVILGSDSGCVGAVDMIQVLQVDPNAQYTWTSSDGIEITPSGPEAEIQFTGDGLQEITVEASNECDALVSPVLEISVIQSPEITGLNGPSIVCRNATESAEYVAPVTNAINWIWTLPSGRIEETDENTINLDNRTELDGELSVYGKNTCGESITLNQYIQFKEVPLAPEAIPMSDTLCPDATDVIFEVEQDPDISQYNWTLTDGVTGSSTSSQLQADFNDASTDFVSVNAENECGTSLDTPIDFTIREAPATPVIAGPDSVCSGSNNITFSTSGTGVFTWEQSGAADEIDNNDTYLVTSGNEPFIVKLVKQGEECALVSDTAKKQIDIRSNPIQAPQVTGPNEACDNETLELTVDYGANTQSIRWILPAEASLRQQSDNSAIIFYHEMPMQTDEIVAVPVNACGDGPSYAHLIYRKADCEFWIADSFTPGSGDEFDTWPIHGVENYPNTTIQVFNRWGNIIYESTGYSEPWDGKFKGTDVPTGTYYYIVDRQKDGEEPISGSVTILRK